MIAPADCSVTKASTPQALEFVRRLQQRQLHRLAEVYCRQQLALEELTDAERAPLVVAILDSLAGRARSQTDLDDSSLWIEAESLAVLHAGELGETAGGLRVELQLQWVRLARAESLLAAADLDLDPDARRLKANKLLRSLSGFLEQLDQRVGKAIQSDSSRNSNRSRPLQRLRQQVHFAWGKSLLRQADCFADRSPDRIHLLTQARHEFKSLARLTPASDLTWESRLREIECHRLLRNFERAHQRLAQSASDQMPPRFRRGRLIEQARLMIQEGNPRSAADLILADEQQGRPDDDPDTNADLRLCLVEAFSVLAKQKNNQTRGDRQQWQNLALDAIRQLEQHANAYWVRRAESILSVYHGDDAGTTDVEIMKRTAANFYRRKQYRDAHVTYQRAAEMAREIGDQNRAFALGLKSAAVLHEARDYSAAAEAFEWLASKDPQHPQAARAHWMAIASTAERVRTDGSLAPSYERLLDEHLRQWPRSKWLDDVKYWRGRLMAQRANSTAAIQIWRSMNPESDRFRQALPHLRLAYHRALENLAGQQRQALATDAFDRFTRWRDAMDGQEEGDSLQALDAGLAAAEFALLYDTAAHQRTASRMPNVDSFAVYAQHFPNRSDALLGLVNALSGQHRSARDHWDRVDWSRYDLAVPLVGRLNESLEQSGATTQIDQLGLTQWDLIQHLQKTDRWRTNSQLLRWGASALARSRQISKAIEVLGQLLAKSPRDTNLLQTLAEQLEARGTADDYQRSVDYWRQVVRLTSPDDSSWYRAKLGIARNLIELGQRRRAVEMIRILQALHPNLGGEELQREFLVLLSNAEP